MWVSRRPFVRTHHHLHSTGSTGHCQRRPCSASRYMPYKGAKLVPALVVVVVMVAVVVVAYNLRAEGEYIRNMAAGYVVQYSVNSVVAVPHQATTTTTTTTAAATTATTVTSPPLRPTVPTSTSHSHNRTYNSTQPAPRPTDTLCPCLGPAVHGDEFGHTVKLDGSEAVKVKRANVRAEGAGGVAGGGGGAGAGKAKGKGKGKKGRVGRK